jgi:hypothetical protein
MRNLLIPVCLASVCAFGQYKMESAGAPPSELAPAIRDALQKDGAKVTGPSGTVAEVWFRTSVPSASNGEQNVSFTDIAHGTLLGVARFPAKATDRRGQPLKPGVYTMRLSFYPVDGAHQGVSPTRDFVLLVAAADDKDLNAAPNFQQLVDMSKKASGTQHPAILNAWKPEDSEGAAVKQEGDDWVLYSTVGDQPIALMVVGTYKA